MVDDGRDSGERFGSLGPYKILRMLGEGGMGEVYEAEQTEPVQRRVALKIIRHGMDTKEISARFEAERQALAMMEHSSIAKVLDAGETASGRPYFVMELVKGMPISEYCDSLKLPIDKRLELFISVCDAVQHAHQKGIIHRDLKPSNILVSTEDRRPLPKVIDFGIAKATGWKLTEKTLVTEHGSALGTLDYAAPEQIGMIDLDVDTRADIYSLGVVLYRLLVGARPFDSNKLPVPAIMRAIADTEPPTPSARLETLTPDLQKVVAQHRRLEPSALKRVLAGDLDWVAMKCLEKDRTRRYQTASELGADLRRHLTDEPILARPPSAVYRARKFMRRNRVATIASLAVILTLVLGATATMMGMLRARRAEAQSERALEATLEEMEWSNAGDAIRTDVVRAQAATAVAMPDFGERLKLELDRVFSERRQIQAYQRIADVYAELGYLGDAERYQRLALEEADDLDVARRVDLLRQLGEIQNRQGHYSVAESTLSTALSLAESVASETGSRGRPRNLLLALAVAREGLGQADAAQQLRDEVAATDRAVLERARSSGR